MRTVLLASLRHNTRRYVASALAVVIGVAFIVTTEGLAGALRDGMTSDIGQPYAAAAHVVQTSSDEEVEALLATAEEEGTSAAPDASSWMDVRVADQRREASIGLAATDPALQWQGLLEGTHPTQPGEVLVDERFAAATGAGVGDEITVGTDVSPFEGRVVGIATVAVGVGANVYLTWADLSPLDPYVPAVLWDGPTAAAEQHVDPAAVLTSDAYVADLQAQMTQGIDVIALLVAFFAAIALGVAVLVIANTFAILFAQRMRDFALLRCVGVTRRQLQRSVRLEALALGFASSALGVALGVGLSFAIAGVVGGRWDELGTPGFRWWWITGAAVFGVLVSVVAAWLPTRTATRVSPLAAMRPAEGFDSRSGAGRVRLGFAALMLVVGGGLLARAVQLSAEDVQLATMVAGGGAFFVGVLLLGPVTAPALVRLLGRIGSRGRSASVAGIAASNAARNPRRTATATASLMVGVTLTVAMLTGLDVVSAAMDEENDRSYPLDAVAVADGGAAFDADAVAATRELGDVAEVLELPGVVGVVAGMEVPVVGVPDELPVLRSDVDLFADSEVVMSWSVINELPPAAAERHMDEGLVDLRVGGRTRTVTVTASNDYGPVVTVPQELLAELAPAATPVTRALWVRAVDGSDAGELETGLNRATSAVPTQLVVEYAKRDWVESQMTVITGAVIGLLSVGVVIALIGIVNTLGLSVLERTRENALLRAMGLTRAQLRRVLAVEGALLAGVASLLGIAVGLLFAWVGVKVMVVGLIEHSFAVPVPALAVILVAAVVFGVLASVLPARQANRVTPAEGLVAG